MRNYYYFFLGTEAELIKTFPVIKEMEDRNIPYRIIASGQNDIRNSRVLQYANGGRVDLILSDEGKIEKTGKGLIRWYFDTRKKAKKMFLNSFPEVRTKTENHVMIVHGDTISTVMGAYLGKRLGMQIAHIEAGLRSHHLFNPFPEEIDRILVDRISNILFVPGVQGMRNLKKKKNMNPYDTTCNTLADSLERSVEVVCEDETIQSILREDYFVFVLHRQENMKNDELIHLLMRYLQEAKTKHKCVVILHKITQLKLEEIGILDELKADKRFILLPRVDYFDFMKLLSNAEYVVTDGGSNQGELYYMGVPTLIVRESTEQAEGIGENIVLYAGEEERITDFFANYPKYRREKKQASCIVSQYIVDVLESGESKKHELS